MSKLTKRVKVPGKLMIAGEYAILEPNQHAIVIAIDRYITVEIEANKERAMSLPHLNLPYVTWKNNGDHPSFQQADSRLALLQSTIKVVNQFLRENSIDQGMYKLTVVSELEDEEGRKYGLGSSAALVVSVITSILDYHQIQLADEKLFKLSVLAHLTYQGNGSGADIAAAVFGGWIYYAAFLPTWVLYKIKEGKTLTSLLDSPWPNLCITPIMPPEDLFLSVGWTKEIARTGPMVDKVQTLRTSSPEKYQYFLKKSEDAVQQIVKGLKTNTLDLVLTGIGENRQALNTLGEYTNTSIETPLLKKLCTIAEEFGSAKPSGAGGGDCGIAVVSSYDQKKLLHNAWTEEGITPLFLKVSSSGVRIFQIN